MSPKEKDKDSSKATSAQHQLATIIVTALLSAGGIKVADNAWPTEIEVRLALIEKQQQETLQILSFLATHHGVDPGLLHLAPE
ncbi:MAG: hypothetical protein V3W44_00680 [Dehalococcoidales bacterium]